MMGSNNVLQPLSKIQNLQILPVKTQLDWCQQSLKDAVQKWCVFYSYWVNILCKSQATVQFGNDLMKVLMLSLYHYFHISSLLKESPREQERKNSLSKGTHIWICHSHSTHNSSRQKRFIPPVQKSNLLVSTVDSKLSGMLHKSQIFKTVSFWEAMPSWQAQGNELPQLALGAISKAPPSQTSLPYIRYHFLQTAHLPDPEIDASSSLNMR